MKTRFYVCRHCGNLVGMIHDAGVPLVCCGEKHVPVISVEDGVVRVRVGSVDHPMLPEHSIQWIYLQTEKGGQRKALAPGDAPAASFRLEDDKAVAAYAYCNLHGLWMTEL